MSTNVNQAVPFFWVVNMDSSLKFYVEGLGFAMQRQWVPDGDGKIRWCRLEIGDAAIMLQEIRPHGGPNDTPGAGVSISFTCQDALALYREFRSRGVQTRRRPFVGNGLWVVPLADPDGYRIEFSSPTDAPEESELEGME